MLLGRICPSAVHGLEMTLDVEIPLREGDRDAVLLEVLVDANRDVVVADVAPVLAQMSGYAVSAGFGGHVRGTQGIGMPTASCVANGGDMVDVDPKPKVISVMACYIHAFTRLEFVVVRWVSATAASRARRLF